jgi:hypothetical protein
VRYASSAPRNTSCHRNPSIVTSTTLRVFNSAADPTAPLIKTKPMVIQKRFMQGEK